MEGTIKGTGAVLFFHVFREVGSQQLCSCTLPSIDQVFFYLVVVYYAGPFVFCYFLAGPSLFVLFCDYLNEFWRCFLFWWNQFLDSY
uniref:Uncharacterized protein n=1 Tax=Gossypium raimondii TaxID=29730 RepID=A0A0D2NZX3_GOSRA|nr:hypothetical protein B456_007G146900 [Gossypium raimondii]